MPDTPRDSVALVLELIRGRIERHGTAPPPSNGWTLPARMTIRDADGKHADIECELRWEPGMVRVGVDYGSTERHRFQVYEVTAGAVQEVSVTLDEPPSGPVWELVKARVSTFTPSPQPRPKHTPPPQPERFRKRGKHA